MASLNPVAMAPPTPWFTACCTIVSRGSPKPRTSWAVPSVPASSTTMMESTNSGIPLTTPTMCAATLNAGITTAIRRPRYIVALRPFDAREKADRSRKGIPHGSASRQYMLGINGRDDTIRQARGARDELRRDGVIRNLEVDSLAGVFLVLRPDRAAMSRHDPPAKCEFQPGGSCLAPRTATGHREKHPRLRPGERHGDGAARAGRRRRVRQDGPQYLHERLPVDPAARRLARGGFKPDAARLKERAQFIHGPTNHGLDRQRDEAEDALSRLEIGEIDGIAEQIQQAPPTFLDRLVIPHRLFRRHRGRPLRAQLRKAEDRVERSPHLVRHGVEEFAPGGQSRRRPIVHALEIRIGGTTEGRAQQPQHFLADREISESNHWGGSFTA